jgi:hypothetical protein
LPGPTGRFEKFGPTGVSTSHGRILAVQRPFVQRRLAHCSLLAQPSPAPRARKHRPARQYPVAQLAFALQAWFSPSTAHAPLWQIWLTHCPAAAQGWPVLRWQVPLMQDWFAEHSVGAEQVIPVASGTHSAPRHRPSAQSGLEVHACPAAARQTLATQLRPGPQAPAWQGWPSPGDWHVPFWHTLLAHWPGASHGWSFSRRQSPRSAAQIWLGEH